MVPPTESGWKVSSAQAGQGVKRRLAGAALALLMALGPASAALGADVIRLGCSLPLSGLQQNSGKLYRKAYDLAVDWINRNGGVSVAGRPHQFKMTYRDDGGEPARTARETELLVTADRVAFLVGPFGSGAVREAAPVAERLGIPLVHASGESAALYGRGYRYLFGMLPSPSSYLLPSLDLLARLTPRPVSIGLAWADDSFDEEVARSFKEAATARGFALPVAERYPTGTRDLAGVIDRLKQADPDAVIVAGHEEEARLFIRQARERDLNARFLAFTVGVTDEGFRKPLGSSADYLFGITLWHPVLDLRGTVFGGAADFARLWREAYQGEVPDSHAAAAAAAVVALKEAVESAGSLDPGAVRDALARLEADTFYGRMAFNPGGQLAVGTYVVQVQKAKVFQVQPDRDREPLYPAQPWKERPPAPSPDAPPAPLKTGGSR